MKTKKLIILFLVSFAIVMLSLSTNVNAASAWVTTAEELQEALGGEEYAEIVDNTVKLKQDVEFMGTLNIVGTKTETFVLDLNGKIMTHKETSMQFFISIREGANLIIKDSSNSEGKFTSNTGIEQLISCQENGTLTIENGTFENKSGAIIRIDDGNVTIKNGTFNSNCNVWMIGDYEDEQELIIENGLFEASDVNVWDDPDNLGTVNITIKNGTFKSFKSNNEENITGNLAASLSENEMLTIENGNFESDCYAIDLYTDEGGKAIINGGSFKGDKIGLLVEDASDITLKGGKFEGSKAGILCDVVDMYEGHPIIDKVSKNPIKSYLAEGYALYEDDTITIKEDILPDQLNGNIVPWNQYYTKPTVTVEPINPRYNITVKDAENGTVTADKAYSIKGGTVTLNATPNENYELKEIVVKTKDGAVIKVENGKFEMPESDVEVTATFAKKTATTNPVDNNNNANGNDTTNNNPVDNNNSNANTNPANDNNNSNANTDTNTKPSNTTTQTVKTLDNNKKDVTPKTGIVENNYVIIPVSIIALILIAAVVVIKKKKID